MQRKVKSTITLTRMATFHMINQETIEIYKNRPSSKTEVIQNQLFIKVCIQIPRNYANTLEHDQMNRNMQQVS